jgi:hypothetical protein
MGSVTQAFAAPPPQQPGPMPGVPPPDMQASGPSEYTRLFKAPAAPPEPAPVAPQVAAAAPAPPKSSKLPLILVIVGLVAVIVVLVLFLVLRK